MTCCEKKYCWNVGGVVDDNSSEAQGVYQEHFPNSVCADYHTFASVGHRLWETGTFAVNRHSTGQGRSVCTLQFDEDILQCFENNPSASTCAIGHAVGVNRLLECRTAAAAPSLLLAERAGSRPQQLPWSRPICALVCTPEYREVHFLQCCCS